MNLYEAELQKMVRGIPFIQRYTLAGRALLGSLDKELRVKISFATTGIAGHYDALKIRIINRTDGEVDAHLVKFKDILSHGKNIVIDEDSDGPSWGLKKPLQSDYIKINQFLHNYLSYFAPEQEETQDIDRGADYVEGNDTHFRLAWRAHQQPRRGPWQCVLDLW